MHPQTREVAAHMRHFGFGVVGRAARDACCAEILVPWSHAMAVCSAEHGAEILIKARIAEEHPLLLFERLPKNTTTNGPLTIRELFEHGRSHSAEGLPHLLWSTTGVRLESETLFREFLQLRNAVMHFAVPDRDLSADTLRFVFQVVEPLAATFWDETVIDYMHRCDDGIGPYIRQRLQRIEVQIDERLDSKLQRFES